MYLKFQLLNKNEIDLNNKYVAITNNNNNNRNKQRKNIDQQYIINKKIPSKVETYRPYNYKQSTGGEIEVHLIVYYE